MFKSGTSIKIAGIFIALLIFLPILIGGSKIISIIENLLQLLQSSGIETDNLATSFPLFVILIIILYFVFSFIVLSLIWVLGNLYDEVGFTPKNNRTKQESILTKSKTEPKKDKPSTSNFSDYQKYLKLKQQLNKQEDKEN